MIIVTKDGSHTVSIPGLNVTYHSHHGAIQESMHVYINAGLAPVITQHQPVIRMLEVGLGTGLNALLSLAEAENARQPIHYTAIELFPLHMQEVEQLNFCTKLNRSDLQPVFKNIHACEWEKDIVLSKHFTLKKIAIDLHHFNSMDDPDPGPYHLVYYDAFAPTAQPELWTKEIFHKLKNLMTTGGLLVTYCSKSIVRSAMRAAGFKVEKVPGPRGKREMVKAFKI